MSFLFLETAVNAGNVVADGAVAGAILALFAAFFIFAVLIMIGFYIYSGFAFMAIARRARYPSPGIAWIPIVGPALIASKTAKMHWWPILLLIGFVIPWVGGLAVVAFEVFFIIWLWKTFEKIGRPGWWAILCIIPIVNLILIGIAAWGKN